MKADLLNDLRGAVDKAIAEGTGLTQFRKDFAAIVQKHGWTGWTGEGSKAGVAWRTKVIYQTNMATSYAAGRWQQLMHPDLLSVRPYWKYHHADGVMYPRPLHVSWNGLVLPHDHPFWKTHFPPNGWGCHCYVSAVDETAYQQALQIGKGEAPKGWQTIDLKTGGPVGIDKGFDYAPGASANRPLKDFIDQKLINLSAPIGSAMWEELASALALEQRQAITELVDRTAQSMQSRNDAALAYVISPETVIDLTDRSIPLVSADIWLRDTELVHALRETKDARSATIPLDAWRNLTDILETATPYLDTVDTALLYVFDLPSGNLGKVVVRVNFTSKMTSGGKRDKLTSNFIRTGGEVDAMNITDDPRYVKLN